MKTGILMAAVAGIVLAACLVVAYGTGGIGAALTTAGWPALIAMSAIHVIPLLLSSTSWCMLFPSPPNNAMALFPWARWLRDSVNDLLPFLPIGGELVGARELTVHGVRAGMAGASTVVDLTMELMAQFVFTFMGLAMLLVLSPGDRTAYLGLLGMAIAAPALVAFVLIQRSGMFRVVERIAKRLAALRHWTPLEESEGIHAGITVIYNRPLRLVMAIFLHLAAWLVGVCEAWVALHFMDRPISLAEAVLLESLVAASRSVAFMVPWGAGVQEGGYVVVGAAVGLGPEAALAVALLRRGREVALAIPALLVWQWREGRRVWIGRRRDSADQASKSRDHSL